MNIRKNLPLVIGGGTCAVLLVVALFFLFRFSLAYQAEKKALKNQYQRLEQLNTRKPFPSAENVARVQDNRETLDRNLEALKQSLNKIPLYAREVAAVDFSSRVQKSIQRFRTKAEAANVALPQNMEVGFSQYASGGAIPTDDNVARLARQLASVEKVAYILIKGGVASIDGLEREVFEDPESSSEDGDAPSETPRSRRSRRSHPPGKKELIKPNNAASFVHPDGLYSYERITVAFTAQEDNVWRVLGLFASAPLFMAVSEVELHTHSTILSYNPEAAKEASTASLDGNTSQQSLAARVLAGTKLSRQERQIAGEELISVKMKVDVYNFEINAQSEEQKP